MKRKTENLNLVGINSQDYADVRNIINVSIDGFKTIKLRSKTELLNVLFYKITKRYSRILFYLHYDFFRKKISLYHFFNTVSIGSKPWVVTFESYVPRWGIYSNFLIRYGVKKLASRKCVKLIAISKCTYKIQEHFLERYPEYKKAILEKTIVLYPPQASFFNAYEDKERQLNHECLNFTLVGNDFYIKGGREILRAFVQVLEEGNTNIKMNIVSTFRIDVFSREYIHDKKEELDLIEKYKDKIKVYSNIENDAVLELLKKSHVGLLPSYADTFGYSVLEAQACGCPVISSNIRALPEINNNETGWLINLPVDDFGTLDLSTQTYEEVSEQLQAELVSLLRSILNNPAIILEKGQKALDKINLQHSPPRYSEELSKIYRECLKQK